MRPLKTLPKAALILSALGLAAATLSATPAQAQDYICPDGYYYIEGYGCAPLGYYYGPTIITPGFGFYWGGGWGRYHGWHGGGYHGGYHGGGYHGGGGGHGGGFHGGGGGHHH